MLCNFVLAPRPVDNILNLRAATLSNLSRLIYGVDTVSVSLFVHCHPAGYLMNFRN